MKEVISIYVIWLLAGLALGALLGADNTSYENSSTIEKIFTIVIGLFLILPWLSIIGLAWLYYKFIKKEKKDFYDI